MLRIAFIYTPQLFINYKRLKRRNRREGEGEIYICLPCIPPSSKLKKKS